MLFDDQIINDEGNNVVESYVEKFEIRNKIPDVKFKKI
jgi:hypothetical protein